MNMNESHEQMIRQACATTFFGRGGSAWLILRERGTRLPLREADDERVILLNKAFPW